jgi:hypothetical protein
MWAALALAALLAFLMVRRWRRRRAPKGNVVVDRYAAHHAVYPRYPGRGGKRRYR